jgi:hypothetical protein
MAPGSWNHVRRQSSKLGVSDATSGVATVGENRRKIILSRRKYVILAILLAVLPITSVLSLHELDHRYDVMGYLLDADGQAIPGVVVAAHLGSERKGSGRSDANGYYRFRLHLHDSDVGRELRLKTPEFQGSVRISLTPGDTSTQRLHHVNFVDGKLLEGELSDRGGISTTMITVAVLGIVLAVGLFVTARLRRLRRRRQRAQQKAAKVQSGGSRNRRRRKKRGR